MPPRGQRPNIPVIKSLRDELELTQEQVAKKSGWSVRHIQDVERGAKNGSKEFFADLAEVLQTTPDAIVIKNDDDCIPDTVIVLFIDRSLYTNLTDAIRAFDPVIKHLSKCYKVIQVKFGSIILMISAESSILKSLSDVYWQRLLAEFGVEFVRIREVSGTTSVLTLCTEDTAADRNAIGKRVAVEVPPHRVVLEADLARRLVETQASYFIFNHTRQFDKALSDELASQAMEELRGPAAPIKLKDVEPRSEGEVLSAVERISPVVLDSLRTWLEPKFRRASQQLKKTYATAKSLPGDAPEELSQVESSEVSETLRQAILKMTDDDQQLVRLMLEGNTTGEIAQSLGLAPNTIPERKGRALEKLRILLAEWGDVIKEKLGLATSKETLGQVFEKHQERLLAMLRRRIDPRLQRRLSPEDMLNDAFLRARRKWPEYELQHEKPSSYAWLYRIALDGLIESWRRETRESRSPDRELPWPDDPSVQMEMRLVDPSSSPSEALVREDSRERLRRALAELKAQDREILWMRHYDQLSYQEAADVLGIKEAVAAARYVRALKRLKQAWEKLYPHD